jgi:hypothetical protein
MAVVENEEGGGAAKAEGDGGGHAEGDGAGDVGEDDEEVTPGESAVGGGHLRCAG